MNAAGLVHANMQHPGSGYRTALVQQKNQAHPASDQAQLQCALRIHRAVDLGRHGMGAELGVA